MNRWKKPNVKTQQQLPLDDSEDRQPLGNRGKPLDVTGILEADQKRFWKKVNKRGPIVRAALGECWVWTGARRPRGYGVFNLPPRRQVYAHRLSFVLHFGPLAGDLEVCHKCDNPPCINPAHLFAGTHRENMHDSIAKGQIARLTHSGTFAQKLCIMNQQPITHEERTKMRDEIAELIAKAGETPKQAANNILRFINERIVLPEYRYWRDAEGGDIELVAMGAVGAAANIAGRLLPP